MEIALESAVPTYSGGLGVLAGGTIRSAADLQVPIVAISLLHRAGHFTQRFDLAGGQSEQPVQWKVEDFLTEMPARTGVVIEGRSVCLRCWKYQVQGAGTYSVPVYLLDTDLPENSEWDRKLTSVLYGGDSHYRLCQEILLGVGGVRMLRALGYDRLDRFHLNEGHASLLILELLQGEAQKAAEHASRPAIWPRSGRSVFLRHIHQFRRLTISFACPTWGGCSDFAKIFPTSWTRKLRSVYLDGTSATTNRRRSRVRSRCST